MTVLKKKFHTLRTFLFAILLTSMLCYELPALAAQGTATVIDDADLLSDTEEAALMDIMQPGTLYGNMVFYTTLDNPYHDVDQLGQAVYNELYAGNADGVILVIDMDMREILLSGYGECQYSLSRSDCITITDNVYRYASDADYYSCAATAFEQVNLILNGKNIPRPMKYICNALLAIALALLINYFVVMGLSKKKKPSNNTMLHFIHSKCDIIAPKVTFIREKRVYNPPSSSGGGGGGRSGGGRSGGGHSSGSHKF